MMDKCEYCGGVLDEETGACEDCTDLGRMYEYDKPRRDEPLDFDHD